MTRLLMPEMFGVMAIANVILFGIALFSDLGLRQNIIQSHRGNDPIFLNTAWTVQIFRGALLWCIGLLIGLALYYIGKTAVFSLKGVYSDPILPWVVSVMAANAFISGFESTKLATANRNLALGKVTLLDLISQVAGILTMLVWVNIDRSIWALVAGAISSSLIKAALSHTALPGERNKLLWDAQSFHEIFHFGKWIFVTSIMGFLISSIDRLLLGALITPKELGVYAIAILLMGAVQDIVSKLISNVAFPAMGEVIRLNPDKIKDTYYKIRLPVDAFCLMSTGILFVSAEAIVSLLYDNRYSQAGQMLSILSLSLVVLRYSVAGQFYIALGKPKLMAYIMSIRLLTLACFIPLGFSLGSLSGAILGVALSGFPEMLVTVLLIKRRLGILNIKYELRNLGFLPIGILLGISLVKIISSFN